MNYSIYSEEPSRYSQCDDHLYTSAQVVSSQPIDAKEYDADNSPSFGIPPITLSGYSDPIFYNEHNDTEYRNKNILDLKLNRSGNYTIPDQKATPIVPQIQILDNTEPATLGFITNIASQPEHIQQGGQLQGRNYVNPIANSLHNYSITLPAIDRIQLPFAQELQGAFKHILEFQQSFQLANACQQRRQNHDLSRHLLHPQQQPGDLPATGHRLKTAAQPHTRRSLSRASTTSPTPLNSTMKKPTKSQRSDNIKSFNSAEFYNQLPYKPLSWFERPFLGEPLFQYNSYGELLPGTTFTAEQLCQYISVHPLNDYKSKHSNLTLWIQVAPADSVKRYGHPNSAKCRFEECPDPARTIRKGDFRIAFDEQYAKGLDVDPFHNAGYVHLYCIEKFIDFPSICHNYNVRPDTRRLPEGKNKMAITRDYGIMKDICLNFIRNSKLWIEFNTDGIRPREYYEHTLCYKLTMEHLKLQPKHLHRLRKSRGGNSIEKHLNNLDKYLAGRKEQRDERKSGVQPGRKVTKKRKADNLEELIEGALGKGDRVGNSR
jgi:hypothetical protein